MTSVFTAVLASIVLASGLSATVQAHEYQEGEILVDHPWARSTPPVTPINAAAYMKIENRGDRDIRLIEITTPITGSASIHESVEEDGLMKMKPAPENGLLVPAGKSVSLEPRSYHLMLMKLQKPLQEGDEFPLILTFDNGQRMQVEVKVTGEAPVDNMQHH